MGNWKELTTESNLPNNEPILVKVKETISYVKNRDKQIYESIDIEYITAAFNADYEAMEIIIPEYPQDNIDNIWEFGTTYVLARRIEGAFIVGAGVNGSRFLSIKEWKEIDSG